MATSAAESNRSSGNTSREAGSQLRVGSLAILDPKTAGGSGTTTISADNSIIIHPEASVCAEAKLSGPYPITIGSKTVLQPGCVIRAKTGPISIGEHCCIEEQVRVVNDTGSDCTFLSFDFVLKFHEFH